MTLVDYYCRSYLPGISSDGVLSKPCPDRDRIPIEEFVTGGRGRGETQEVPNAAGRLENINQDC